MFPSQPGMPSDQISALERIIASVWFRGQDDKWYVGTNTAESQNGLDHFQKQAPCEVGTFLASRNARYWIVQRKKKKEIRETGWRTLCKLQSWYPWIAQGNAQIQTRWIENAPKPSPQQKTPASNRWSMGWRGDNVVTWKHGIKDGTKKRNAPKVGTPGRGDKGKEGKEKNKHGTPSVCTIVKGILNYTSIISASSAKISSAGPQLPSKTVAPARRRWLINCTP